MAKILFIAGGGALGSLLRYALHGWVQRSSGSGTFPIGTLAVNVLGCFLIGLITAFVTRPSALIAEEYRLGLTVGLLGGFTTFSAFGLETFILGTTQKLGYALLNIVLSCGLGLLAVWLGHLAAVHWIDD
ncbi:MAG: fluoride efflux transporter CrcB [Pirellulales bacterium]|nr:fluoride efflux transporter CrcB [Pirellulales bacterium]